MTRSITMTILVTGSTGVIGSQVVANLAEKGAEVHALTRSPEKTKFPCGVTPVKDDLMDIDATQAAIAKTSTLFLLNAVTPDEVTQALLTPSLAQEAGIKRIVAVRILCAALDGPRHAAHDEPFPAAGDGGQA
jgi:uncharacterized protein YbjT (DUF2867 family)